MATTKKNKVAETTQIGDVTLSVEATEYSDRAMFMRMTRAEGEMEDGRRIEVATNELGYGIIVRVGDRQFVISEHKLIDAVLDFMEKEE